MKQYWIPKISASHVIAASELNHGEELSFDRNRLQDAYYMEMTLQDECALFDQLEFLLSVPYSKEFLRTRSCSWISMAFSIKNGRIKQRNYRTMPAICSVRKG